MDNTEVAEDRPEDNEDTIETGAGPTAASGNAGPTNSGPMLEEGMMQGFASPGNLGTGTPIMVGMGGIQSIGVLGGAARDTGIAVSATVWTPMLNCQAMLKHLLPPRIKRR